MHEINQLPNPPNSSDQDLPKPDSCRLAGLECRPCVQNTAVNLSLVCQNLSSTNLRDSFFKIYPDTACLPMSPHFGRAYRAALKSALLANPPPPDEGADILFCTTSA